jgi:HSP20 family molecular chaperone IbpA
MGEPEETEEGYVHWLVEAALPGHSAAEVRQRFDERIRARWQPRSATEPPLDVFVVGRELWVEVDLPGVPEDQVSVRVESGMLVIEARRELEPPARDAPALRRERVPGTLKRRLLLPALRANSALETRCEAGVLRVRIRLEGEEG